MTVQADAKAPTSLTKVERVVDFSGGLNTTIDPSLLNKNEAQEAEDISFEQKGTIIPRKGRKKRYLNSFSAFPSSGLGALYRKDGTSRLVVTSGDTIYYDEPHLATKYTDKADWQLGVVNEQVNMDDPVGSLTMQYGLTDMATFGTPATYGTSPYTYGMIITPSIDILVSKIKAITHSIGATYTLYIWKVSDKSVLLDKDFVSLVADTWETIKLYSAPVKLLAGVQYMIGITSVASNCTSNYSAAPTMDSRITLGACYELSSDGYPTTANASKAFAINLGFDNAMPVVDTFDDNSDWSRGTNKGVAYNTSLSMAKEGADVNIADADNSIGTFTQAIGINTTTRLKGRVWSEFGGTHFDGS